MSNLNQLAEAVAAFDRSLQLGSNDPLTIGMLAQALSLAGFQDSARVVATGLLRRPNVSHVPLSFAALVTGDKNRALTELEQAYAAREPFMIYLQRSNLWPGLENEPRFQALLRKMNYP